MNNVRKPNSIHNRHMQRTGDSLGSAHGGEVVPGTKAVNKIFGGVNVGEYRHCKLVGCNKQFWTISKNGRLLKREYCSQSHANLQRTHDKLDRPPVWRGVKRKHIK